MLFQAFFFGMVFYNYLYTLPLYYQNVRRYTPIHSALMTLPMTLVQSFASVCGGQYISRRKRYGEIIWSGYTLFTIGTCLATLFGRTTPKWVLGVVLAVLGYGNGFCFQPTIIALQAHCLKSQRAVVISVRNFLRCLGGAIGLAISSAIMQNTLRGNLPEQFKYLSHSTYARPDYSKFSAADGLVINDAYAKASRSVFIFMAPCAGLCLIACVFVKDKGLTRPDETPENKQTSDPEKGSTAAETEEDRSAERSVRSIQSTEEKEDDKGSQMDEIVPAEKVMEMGQLGDPKPMT